MNLICYIFWKWKPNSSFGNKTYYKNRNRSILLQLTDLLNNLLKNYKPSKQLSKLTKIEKRKILLEIQSCMHAKERRSCFTLRPWQSFWILRVLYNCIESENNWESFTTHIKLTLSSSDSENYVNVSYYIISLVKDHEIWFYECVIGYGSFW